MFPALLTLGLLVSSAQALTCDCGFIDPLDSTNSLWTSYFETNFSASSQLNLQYRVLKNNLTKNGALNRLFVPENVKLDDEGVHLTVSAWQDGQTDVLGAELETNQTDLWFGSYHLTAKMSETPGTVQAFFTFQSDTNEVDIEYVGRANADANQDPLKFSVKPQEYDSGGAPLPSTLVTFPPPSSLTSDFHNYSFLWNPSSVTFFFDDKQSGSPLTTNVPQLAGMLAISHWSDGNPKYSGGPPTTDAVLTVQRVWAFYNSTNVTSLPCVNSKAPCRYGEYVFPTLPGGSGGGGGGSGKPGSARPAHRVGFWMLLSSLIGAAALYTLL